MRFAIVACKKHRLPLRRHCAHSECRWLECNVASCELIYDPATTFWKGDDAKPDPEAESTGEPSDE